MITELAVFPQTHYVDGRGQTGTRKWVVGPNDDLDEILQMITASHWPGRKDCIATEVQCGPMHDAVIVTRACDNPRYYQTLGNLPKYSKYQIVARYQLFRMNDCWPEEFGPKPYHPVGSTLTIESKGGGQYLLVSPAGMQTMAPDAVVCQQGEAVSSGFLGKVRVPVIEYHLTCDRLTRTNVDGIFQLRDWNELLGCVNEGTTEDGSADLLKAPSSTLLFDNYTLTPSEICHSITPHRWKLTAILKRRAITDANGYVTYDSEGHALGWNHDYINIHDNDQRWGWRLIQIWEDGNCRARYPEADFNALFGDGILPACGDEDEELTEITDTQFCHD